MAKAIDAGIPKLRIEEAAARTQARIDSGRQPVIGVNKYRVAERRARSRCSRSTTPGVRAQQLEKLRRLRAERDEQATCQDALRALTAAAGPGARRATCWRWPSTRPGPRPRSARSPTRWRRCTAGTPARSVPSPVCTATRPATVGRAWPRRRDAGRRVRRGGGPAPAHPGRQDGPGRARPRPEGDRHRVRRPRLRRRRRPAVPDAGRGRAPGRRGRRARRRRVLAGRRAPHAGAGAARRSWPSWAARTS